jgi:hypothetical protein
MKSIKVLPWQVAAETNKQGEIEHADSIIVGTGREKIRIPVLYLPSRGRFGLCHIHALHVMTQ